MTIRSFELIRAGDQMIVIGTDYRGLDYFSRDMCLQLNELQFVGVILLDLLLSNGKNRSRFFRAYFDGKKLVSSSIESVGEISTETTLCLEDFYGSNPDLLRRGVLHEDDIETLNYHKKRPKILAIKYFKNV